MPQNQIPPNTRMVDGKVILNDNADDAESRLTGLEGAPAPAAPTWTQVTNKPTSFPPATHNHDTIYPHGDPSGATDGQVLAFDATRGLWLPKTPAAGGAVAIDSPLVGAGSAADHLRIPAATASAAGYMAAADKSRFDHLGYTTSLTLSVAQSIPLNSWTEVAWNSEVQDDENLWVSTNPGRVVIKSAGLYMMLFTTVWFSITPTSSGVRYGRVSSYTGTVRTSISAEVAINSAVDPFGRGSYVALGYCRVGDQISADVYQTSGAALNVGPDSPTRTNPALVVARIG